MINELRRTINKSKYTSFGGKINDSTVTDNDIISIDEMIPSSDTDGNNHNFNTIWGAMNRHGYVDMTSDLGTSRISSIIGNYSSENICGSGTLYTKGWYVNGLYPSTNAVNGLGVWGRLQSNNSTGDGVLDCFCGIASSLPKVSSGVQVSYSSDSSHTYSYSSILNIEKDDCLLEYHTIISPGETLKLYLYGTTNHYVSYSHSNYTDVYTSADTNIRNNIKNGFDREYQIIGYTPNGNQVIIADFRLTGNHSSIAKEFIYTNTSDECIYINRINVSRIYSSVNSGYTFTGTYEDMDGTHTDTLISGVSISWDVNETLELYAVHISNNPGQSGENNFKDIQSDNIYIVLPTDPYIVDPNDQWVQSNNSDCNPNTSLYDCYSSVYNVGLNNSESVMYIDIGGVSTFTMYIRSYAESNYDYVMAGELGMDISRTTAYNNTTLVKGHTRGFQKSSIALTSSNYKTIVYNNMDSSVNYRIKIVYRKDGSTSSYSDKGFVLLPHSNNKNCRVAMGVPTDPWEGDGRFFPTQSVYTSSYDRNLLSGNYNYIITIPSSKYLADGSQKYMCCRAYNKTTGIKEKESLIGQGVGLSSTRKFKYTNYFNIKSELSKKFGTLYEPSILTSSLSTNTSTTIRHVIPASASHKSSLVNGIESVSLLSANSNNISSLENYRTIFYPAYVYGLPAGAYGYPFYLYRSNIYPYNNSSYGKSGLAVFLIENNTGSTLYAQSNWWSSSCSTGWIDHTDSSNKTYLVMSRVYPGTTSGYNTRYTLSTGYNYIVVVGSQPYNNTLDIYKYHYSTGEYVGMLKDVNIS